MNSYKVYESNAGDLFLVAYNSRESVIWAGEYTGRMGSLSTDIEALRNGANPVSEWDDGVENPKQLQDTMGCDELNYTEVANESGILWASLGHAARNEFKFARDNGFPFAS